MTKNLSELLADARGGSIRYGDVDVSAMYELSLNARSVLRVAFDEVTADLPQALHLKAEGGTLLTNGMSLKDAIFWTDSAPLQFDVSFTPSRPKAVIKIWNEWRDENGVEQAWVGNAGIVIARDDNELLFKCSDGVGPPNFDDFIVRIRIESNVVDFASRRLLRGR
jgi:hypothetical protein